MKSWRVDPGSRPVARTPFVHEYSGSDVFLIAEGVLPAQVQEIATHAEPLQGVIQAFHDVGEAPGVPVAVGHRVAQSDHIGLDIARRSANGASPSYMYAAT